MQPPPLPQHHREHPRVAAGFPVEIVVRGARLLARARDFSMTGLFLEGPPELPDRFAVRIPLPGGEREVATACRVERRQPDGVALSFSQIDWDDLLLIARYMAPRL